MIGVVRPFSSGREIAVAAVIGELDSLESRNWIASPLLLRSSQRFPNIGLGPSSGGLDASFIFAAIIELVRRDRLKERYSFLWFITAGVLILFTLRRDWLENFPA